jgi:sodium/potassium/calcium exchanger 6
MKCTHKSIFKLPHESSFMCGELVEGLCDDNQKIINFLSIFWCDFSGNIWIMIPFVLLMFVLIFKYVSITVEEYIADALARVTEFLEMSDSLAAVTLLAFANGAADMMTVLIASESEGGISYNIGSLYGGGLFVCSAVVPFCIFVTDKHLKLNKMIVYRLIIFYIVAAAITISFAIHKYITWWGSCILLLLYSILVVVVTIDDRRMAQAHPNMSIHPYSFAYSEKESEERLDESRQGTKLLKLHEKVIDLAEYEHSRMNRTVERRRSSHNIHQMRFSHDIKLGDKVHTYFEPRSVTEEYRVKLDFVRDKRKVPVSELTFGEAVVHLIETPFLGILYLTVLPCDKEQYSKLRCLMYPFPGMLFSMWVIFQDFSFKMLMLSLGLGFLLTFIFIIFLEEDRPPRWLIIINIGGLIGGLMWTYLLIGTLIDLIECTGILLNLNKTFLGLTVLAVGSSIPDALTTITLCKQLESIMAISGAYAGQLFALTVAFGISMLKLTLKEGRQEFDLFDPNQYQANLMNILVIFTNLIVLFYTVFYSVRNHFILHRDFAYVLLTIYVVFIVTATILGITEAIKTF